MQEKRIKYINIFTSYHSYYFSYIKKEKKYKIIL